MMKMTKATPIINLEPVFCQIIGAKTKQINNKIPSSLNKQYPSLKNNVLKSHVYTVARPL